VGGVITLGAGAAGAVLASLGRRPTRRQVLFACLVPVLGIVALVGLDLLTGGGAHLTRTVVHGEGAGGFLDIIKRRSVISWRGLSDTWILAICLIGIVCFVLAVRNRDRVFAPLRDHPAFMAGLWGGLAATVFGALGNDSGPLIFALGFLILLFAAGYVRGGMRGSPESATPRRRRTGAVAPGQRLEVGKVV
jgi:hypothetical protein